MFQRNGFLAENFAPPAFESQDIGFVIRRDRFELAVMESVESGKPIRDIMTVDLPETLHCLEWHAEATDKLYDQVSPSGDDALGLVVREPLGVVATVLPWNFPLMMVAWKIGPALSAGNSVIVIEHNLDVIKTADWIVDLGPEGGAGGGKIIATGSPEEVAANAASVTGKYLVPLLK